MSKVISSSPDKATENLHRADLTKLESDEQIAEWVKITDRISAQIATKMERGRTWH
ncbi:hypothetical protein ACFFWD_23195 [Bradyrhizobium erythrophlei]|uniref:hypothetical protein n=1 Tax=Bradyrhizobium erythrophlei TaxID=1437360 RepID=UPI0035ECAAC5